MTGISKQINRQQIRTIMHKPWIKYYKYNDPYCSTRHREKSYEKTYTDLMTLLKNNSFDSSQSILDIGAGTLEQFRLVKNLQNFKWYIVEPAIMYSNRPPSVIETYRSIHDVIPNEDITVATMLSVSQYLDKKELSEYFLALRHRFKNLHTVIISDVIIDETNQLKDLLVYVFNAFRFGYFWMAIIYLFKLRFGGYYALRNTNPLQCYTHSDLVQISQYNGFKLQYNKKNLGYNFNRTTIILRK